MHVDTLLVMYICFLLLSRQNLSTLQLIVNLTFTLNKNNLCIRTYRIYVVSTPSVIYRNRYLMFKNFHFAGLNIRT